MAGSQHLEVLGAGVSCGGLVGECDAVVQMHYLAVAFPKGKVDGVARMKHCEGGCMMDCVCHYEKGFLKVSWWIRSIRRRRLSGRVEACR